MEHLRLKHAEGPDLVVLREITGIEEQAVAGTSTMDAIVLLDALVVSDYEGALKKNCIARLTPWDREQLLAMVYRRMYGAKIESTLECGQCAEKFVLDFELNELLKFLRPADHENLGLIRLENGTFGFGKDITFRLPTGEDECSVVGLSPDEAKTALLNRCVQDSPKIQLSEERSESIQAVMEALSPLVDVELDAKCPECGHEQRAHFDLQHYLLSSIRGERKRLMAEVHALASNYGWSLSEILGLPRSQRRTLAGLIEAEEEAGL